MSTKLGDTSLLRSDEPDTLSDRSEGGNMTTEHIFKLVVLGSYNVGKTTFIKRLLRTQLPSDHDGRAPAGQVKANSADDDEIVVKPTIGTDFYSCVVPEVIPGTSVRLQLWDTAGLEKYAAVNETTYKNSSFVICLFDVSNRSSLEEVTDRHLAQAAEFIPDLEQSGIFVVANKIDLLDAGAEKARARSQQRAASPEAAFCAATTATDDDATADITSSAINGSKGPNSQRDGDDGPSSSSVSDDIVTVKDVRECVLDLFAEVHYGEVSAASKDGMAEFLQRLCLALLQNAGALPDQQDVAEVMVPFDMDRESCLPLTADELQPPNEVPSAVPPSKTRSKNDPPHTTTVPPSRGSEPTPSEHLVTDALSQTAGGPPSVDNTAVGRGAAGAKESGSPTAGSWRNSGFSFDMPAGLDSTSIFSPSSVPPTPMEGGASATATRPGAGQKAGAPAHVDPTTSNDTPPLGRKSNPNETRQERMAREKAEMTSLLLGKKRGSNATDASTPSASGTTARPWMSVDEGPAEDDETAPGRTGGDRFRKNDLDGVGDAPQRGRQFRSVLDDIQDEKDKKRCEELTRNLHEEEEDDDDGAGMTQRIQDRYAQIENHAELDRQAIRDAEKKDKRYGTNTAEELRKKSKEKEGAAVADMYKKKKAKTMCDCTVM